MRNIFLATVSLALFVLVAGCKKDNYEPPKSQLTGQVVFQGQPVGVRSGGVQLELWQPGPQFELWKSTKIPVYVAQDGTFSAMLFDGDYKLTRLKGNGPWVDNTDTINVQVRGATTVDVPVDAYFVVKGETFQKSGSNISATFSLQRGNTSKNLEEVRLYLGQTIITDQNNNVANATKAASTITNLTQPINLSVALPASFADKDYVFARVGVKTAGVAELAFSMPQKIALK
ncbi:MAG: DUF3823 domain-containing protein [Flavisolibacter sp.]|nr:DUF3823 domain-containing protein [Flavisolibacter sp.]